MGDVWYARNLVRVTENGSLLDPSMHTNFREIGQLAHELGDQQKHDKVDTLENELGKNLSYLEVALTEEDRILIRIAVQGYVALARNHTEDSELYVDSPDYALAALKAQDYKDSGLAANLDRVLP